MSLRVLTVIFLGITFVVTLFAARWFLDDSLFKEFRQYEAGHITRNLNTAMEFLNSEVSHLDTVCQDWAFWDDTWEWMLEGSDEYVEANLVEDTFETLELNLVAIIDLEGNYRYFKSYELRTDEEEGEGTDSVEEEVEDILGFKEPFQRIFPAGSN